MNSYLIHSGKGHNDNPPGRGSGRYPWGSGKRPKQGEEKKKINKETVKKLITVGVGSIATVLLALSPAYTIALPVGVATIGAAASNNYQSQQNLFQQQLQQNLFNEQNMINGIINDIGENFRINNEMINHMNHMHNTFMF